jgi:putative addiction module killer protein
VGSTWVPHFVTNSNIYVTIEWVVIEIREYLDTNGDSPFRAWFDELDAAAAAKVTVAVARLEQGNVSRLKSAGGGILEHRIEFGPGYRIYLGRGGDTLVILLGGGTKKHQQRDIEAARVRWADFKRRKRKG